MLILKHLKTLQHVSIFIQIIFRALVSSFLKSLILKTTEFKIFLKVNCGDAAAVGKYDTAGQVTDDNMAHAHCMLDT